jgi:hypothetical protein
MFNAAAGICKALAKQLTAALPATLKHTAGGALQSFIQTFAARMCLEQTHARPVVL